MPELSILIVSWNVSDLLSKCLESILSSPQLLHTSHPGTLSIEIIVVDSASSDDTVAMLNQRFPQVKLLAQTENVGFTRGNNIALREAKGRYLLLLNPDTEVLNDAVHLMVSYLEQHPDVGIVGPHT